MMGSEAEFNPVNIEVGANIKNRRESLEMSIEGLAEMLDITPEYLGLVESGRQVMDISKLPKLSKILLITVDEILSVRQ